jgi:hypothetical protein
MSLTANRHKFPKSALPRFDSIALLERCFEEGIHLEAGAVVGEQPDWQLTEEMVAEIQSGLYDYEFDALIEGKSWGAQWMARHARSHYMILSLDQLRSDLAAYRDISRWMRNNKELCEAVDATPNKLLGLDLRFAWQARRFIELYSQVAVCGRPWGSCYQPDQRKVKAIALCPNFNRLPMWVKRTMVYSSISINTTDRVGNIWRYIPCAKAWKHAPNLPKRIAEKVGRLSIKARMLSAIAWQEDAESFWETLNQLLKAPLGEVLCRAFSCRMNWGRRRYGQLIALYLGLPHDMVNLPREVDFEACLAHIEHHGSPEIVCQSLFGCSGKGTIAAFRNSDRNARDWAMQLAHGNPDLVQKYLGADCIPFQPDAVSFLLDLGDRAALRMVTTTTYKVRGETKPVEDYLVRDTGYLWSSIQNKPKLGRVRCWLSVHEDLARAFIAEQPDEALPINPDFAPLDGLAAIDKSWEIVFPRSTRDLKLWGQLLSHCVGGYGPAIKSGRSIIFAVLQDGRPTYTVEYSPCGEALLCRQFYGLRNCSAPHDLQREVQNAIQQGLS